jgi:hypothetical protein
MKYGGNDASRQQSPPGKPSLLRLGAALLAVSSVGLLAAPATIVRVMPDLSTRSGRHTLAGVLALTAVAIFECVLAIVPIRRGERWALATAAVPFVVIGLPIFVVDATHVAPDRLWNTLAPQGAGLALGVTALILCALGIQKR